MTHSILYWRHEAQPTCEKTNLAISRPVVIKPRNVDLSAFWEKFQLRHRWEKKAKNLMTHHKLYLTADT